MLYKYRVLKAAHGIAIDIDGEAFALDFDRVDVNQLNKVNSIENLWIDYNEVPNVIKEEQELIEEALVLLLTKNNYIFKEKTRIIFHKIWRFITDYQTEQMTFAVLEWGSRYFQLEKPKYSIEYINNKYVFEFKK